MASSNVSPFWFGIDVSKKDLYVAYLDSKEKLRSCRFANSGAGFGKLLAKALEVSSGELLSFCMESTGDYGVELALFLAEAGHSVSIVNPAWIKSHGTSKGFLNKTDKADAKLICNYAMTHCPPQSDLCNPDKRRLFRLHRRHQQLTGLIASESNRRECPGAIGPDSVASIKRSLKFLRAELREIEGLIRAFVEETPRYRSFFELVKSFPNSDLGVFLALVAEMPDPDWCQSAKDFAASAGGHSVAKQSGTSLNNSVMSRGGKRLARRMLWMATLGWIRKMPELASIYNRLRKRGRLHKQAMVAAQHKFFRIAYGVLKSGQPYKPIDEPAA